VISSGYGKPYATPVEITVMPTLLITCTAGKLGLKRQMLLNEIYSFSATQLTPSVYAIRTECSPKEIFKRLKPYIEYEDTLYVSQIGDTVGHGNSDTNDWLETNLNGRTLH
jgi:hypothetical protein